MRLSPIEGFLMTTLFQDVRYGLRGQQSGSGGAGYWVFCSRSGRSQNKTWPWINGKMRRKKSHRSILCMIKDAIASLARREAATTFFKQCRLPPRFRNDH